MDILINKINEEERELPLIIQSILDSIIDNISSQNVDNSANQMELEKQACSSSSSSSEDNDFLEKAMKIQEGSEDEMENPQEKFCTRNERKIILYEDESKQQREQRFGLTTEILSSENKKKIGIIQSFFENTIVIRPLIKEVLDLDNIIFAKDEILGKIDDVFGNVDFPFYSILAEPYISKKFQDKTILLKDDVFVFEKNVKIILQSSINEIKRKIGCDASNMIDEEICNEKEMDFSDDEKETKLKNRKKQKDKAPADQNPSKEGFKNNKDKKHFEKHKEFVNKVEHYNTNKVERYNMNKNAHYNMNKPDNYNKNYGYNNRINSNRWENNNNPEMFNYNQDNNHYMGEMSNPYFNRTEENNYYQQNQNYYGDYSNRNNVNNVPFQTPFFNMNNNGNRFSAPRKNESGGYYPQNQNSQGFFPNKFY